MDHEILQKAYQAVAHGQKCAFATIIATTDKGSPRKPGAKMVVFEDGTIYGTIGGGWSEEAAKQACLKAIQKKRPGIETYTFDERAKTPSQCGGEIQVFIEPLPVVRNFILCGAGHIALPLSMIVKTLNYRLTVLDDRAAFANAQRFPHADTITVGHPAATLRQLSIQPSDAVMIVTHAHQHDYACLEAVIQSQAAYIGVIASKTKKDKMLAALKEKHVPEDMINRVRTPAGLDIGAQTPAEIAVAIAAELIALENQAYVGSAKFQAKHTPLT
jgi:xanthine dehydrogenase accessory factor